LGDAFLEHLVYDDSGQILTGTLADYLIPQDRAAGASLAAQSAGREGAGEGGIIPAGALMANAVTAALRSLRVEPEFRGGRPTRRASA
jgi:carbon-monoxide dehydrogenase large subunit